MNKIINTELLQTNEYIAPFSALAVVIDPPYGYGESKGIKIKGLENNQLKWDTIGNANKVQADACRISDQIINDDGLIFVFSPYERIDKTMQALRDSDIVVGGVAVWDKRSSRPRFVGIQQTAEFIVWGHRLGCSTRPKSDGLVAGVFGKSSIQKSGRWHPTPKPVEVIEWLLKAAPDGLVVDLCAGTCSTAKAAHNMGRPWVMIERDSFYTAQASQDLTSLGIDHQHITHCPAMA